MKPRIRITRNGMAYITLRDLVRSENFKEAVAAVRRLFGTKATETTTPRPVSREGQAETASASAAAVSVGGGQQP